jgi:hypothetical protein
MMRGWGVALVCLLVAGWAPAAGAAGNAPLARGARVGIITLLDAGIIHFHVARNLQDSFLKTHNVAWRIDLMLASAVKDRFQEMGLEAVPVSVTSALERVREPCFVNGTPAKGLPRDCASVFAQLATAERLDAIIVLAPGLNNSDHGRRRRELPEYLRGWGFVTGNGAKPSLFNMTELLLLGVTGETVSLRGREWGGGYTLDWVSHEAQPDEKALAPEELDKLEPLFADILTRQCSRLLDQVDSH